MSAVFPDGIESLADIPHPYHDLLKMGLYFLSFEELQKNERPPKNIWLDVDMMKKWWEAVEQQREEEANPDKQIEGPTSRNTLMDDLIANK